jgi:16S rRNA processing protein RimM
MEQLFNIGKLVATFGVQGQLILQHALGKKTSLKGIEVMMVEIRKGETVPFFVTEVKIKNDSEVYVRFEDIDSKEKAKKLVPRPVWFKEADFKKYVAKLATISLLGYMIFDKKVPLSEIVEVIEQPHQVLAKIIYQEKEMLIPVNEAFIVDIHHKNKTIELDLPEGLLDIYL